MSLASSDNEAYVKEANAVERVNMAGKVHPAHRRKYQTLHGSICAVGGRGWPSKRMHHHWRELGTGSRLRATDRCPSRIHDIGAIFVPFNAQPLSSVML